ncbi:MAG: histidine triad nucleotide-binding protein, partial [Oscillospiraceae bacterium]
MSDCLFCKIAAGEIPSNKVYEDELVFAFYDIAPQAPTHFLVIPKTHIASCGAITPENSAIVAHCFEVISQVTRELGISEFRVVSNCGESAGQSVAHLHFHVL